MRKRSNYILVLILFIGMIAFNWTFNIFTNAVNVTREEHKFSRENIMVNFNFSNKTDTKDIIIFMEELENRGLSNLNVYNQNLYAKELESGYVNEYTMELGLITNENLIEYPILKGRNFTREEIIERKKVIVLSYIFEHLTYKKDNKTFIEFQDEEYEVIGIIKSLRGESYHNLKGYIPYKAKPQKQNLTASDNILTLIMNLNEIGKLENINLKELGIENYNLVQIPVRSVEERIDFFTRDYQNFVVIFVAAIINILIFILYWVKCRQKINYTYKMLGYTNRDICKIVLKESSIVVLVVSILSSLGYILIEEALRVYIVHLTICWSIYMLLMNLIIGVIVVGLILGLTTLLLSFNDMSLEKKMLFSKSKLVRTLIIFQIATMTLNFISAYRFLDEYYSAVTLVNKLEEPNEELFFIDPFSVSNDIDVLLKSEPKKLFEEIIENEIKMINYVYGYELLNLEKNKGYHEYLSDLNKANDVAYGKDGFIEGVFLYVKDSSLQATFDSSDNKIPVVLGKGFKKYYEINDEITTENGTKYQVIDFLDEQEFYNENRNSMHLANTISLDEVIVVPVNSMEDINKISMFYNDIKHLEAELFRNTIYNTSSNDEKKALLEILKESKVKLMSKNYARDFYRSIYLNGVIFQLTLAVITFGIAVLGLYSYIMIIIEENMKKISIKYSLGYRKIDIFKELLLDVLILFGAGYLLTCILIKLQQFGEIDSVSIIFMILNLAISLLAVGSFIYIKLKNFKPVDLLRGE